MCAVRSDAPVTGPVLITVHIYVDPDPGQNGGEPCDPAPNAHQVAAALAAEIRGLALFHACDRLGGCPQGCPRDHGFLVDGVTVTDVQAVAA